MSAPAPSSTVSPPDAPTPNVSDPLDLLETPQARRLLAEKGATLPTTTEAIEGYLESLALLAQRAPDNQPQEVQPHIDSTQFQALGAILDEETPDDRAENYKTSGNEAFKLAGAMKAQLAKESAKASCDQDMEKVKKLENSILRRYEDAFNYYTHGILVNPPRKRLLSQLYSNRAQIHLVRENLGYALQDAKQAIGIDANNQRGYYRAATAILRMKKPEKLEEALKYATQGQECKYMDKIEKREMQRLAAEISALIEEEKEKQRLIEMEKKKKRDEERHREKILQVQNQKLADAIAKRGLIVGKPAFKTNAKNASEESSNYYAGIDAALYHSQTVLNEDSTLSWPVLMLYPEKLQSDFIQSVHEQHPLIAHLEQMFPPTGTKPDWDLQDEYRMENLNVFIEVDPNQVVSSQYRKKLLAEPASNKTDEGKVRILVDARLSVGAILSSQELVQRGYIIPGIPTFTIIPKK